MDADLAAARREGGPPMRLRTSPAQFPRATGKRTSGQMARFRKFQLCSHGLGTVYGFKGNS